MTTPLLEVKGITLTFGGVGSALNRLSDSRINDSDSSRFPASSSWRPRLWSTTPRAGVLMS